jgi:hypothetical protein
MYEYKLIPPPVDEHEEELKVGPVEAESAAEVLARLERRDRVHEEPPIKRPSLEPAIVRPTFTIRQMLIVITVLGIWLGVLRWLSLLQSASLFGTTGVVALAAMLWIATREDQPRIFRTLWWGMLLVYLTCSMALWMAG